MSISAYRTFALDVLEGLSSNPKYLPAKYHYDEKGSQLFQKITELKEYYLTRYDLSILDNFKQDLVELVARKPFRMVELGVGDARKTNVLLKHFLNSGLSFEYVPVDCCQYMLSSVVTKLSQTYANSNLNVLGITADYFNALSWLGTETSKRNLVLFLGSSIGNFGPIEVKQFLYHMWSVLKNGDYLLMGFDLKKDVSVVEAAYNDIEGVTSEFNFNLLDRMNEELGANFNRKKFKFHSYYNPREGRIESWLLSKEPQTVSILELQKDVDFEAWEGIHVENSYKFSLKDIKDLAESTGFVLKNQFIDNQGYFAETLWEVKKIPRNLGANHEEFESIQKAIAGSLLQN